MSENFHYTFSVKWTAILGVLSFGILVPTFFIPMELGSKEHFLSILIATLTSAVIWEGSKLIQALILYWFPWEKSIVKHLVYEIVCIFVFSSIGLLAGILTYATWFSSSVHLTIGIIIRNIFVSFLLALLFTAFNEGAFLFSKWKSSLIEQERLRQENLIAKIESLKKQLDPHFLFNSLSVLSGVVYQDPLLADRFITKLAQVYRYVLEHNDAQKVSLTEEILFVQAYCFLLNVRFLNKVTLSVKPISEASYVLPMSVQLLVENAVKHNRISEHHPLKLTIYEAHGFLWIENNLNPKPAENSTGIGLKNLEARYKYVTGKSLIIEEKSDTFKVGIPLIQE